MKRKAMSKKISKKVFRKTSGVHKLNLNPRRARGGIRL